MAIRLFITGGTIDKSKAGPPDVGYDHQKSFVLEMLKNSRVSLDVKIEHLMNKSSRLLTAQDRDFIAKKCNEAPEERIIITHGTITLSETANFLAQRISDKTIVLTGSIIPYALGMSDAMFNLGCAFIAVQTQPYGVFATMEGRVYSYPKQYYDHSEISDVKKKK